MPADTADAGAVAIDARRLISAVADIFTAAGIAAADAQVVAADLVAADLEGISSHGVMLLPMYIERIAKGSVSRRSAGDIVSDHGGAIVIDAGNALGQLTARQAVKLAVARAREIGLAAVGVRNGFHFGTAGRYARMMAEHNCVGIVLSKTAMGKIRLAAAAGQRIPEDWALDSRGRPTTDPAAAIKGMLLPAAGPKGFGLAFVIDLLCGGLSDGAVGAEVRPLYGDPAAPYRCAHFFLAIHAGHFPVGERFAERVRDQAIRVSGSKRGPGVDRVYAPGELVWATRQASEGVCRLDAPTVKSLVDAAARVGLGDFESSLLAARAS
jgi:LDH2 family malate/lactate/ureidoglycolate dehydrogenase